MLILQLKNHTHPRTYGWFIDRFIQVTYISGLCQNYICIIYILAHTRTPQPIVGCSDDQVPTKGRVFANRLLWDHCEERGTRRSFPPAREVSRNGGPPPLHQNVPGKRALWAAATWWHPGTSPKRGPSLRLPGQVFPPFGRDPGWGFFVFAVPELSVKPCASRNGIIWFKWSLMAVS